MSRRAPRAVINDRWCARAQEAFRASIDNCDAALLALPPCPVHWFASNGPAPQRLAASAARLAECWANGGTTLHLHLIDGNPFWSGASAHCQALLDATSATFAQESP